MSVIKKKLHRQKIVKSGQSLYLAFGNKVMENVQQEEKLLTHYRSVH